MKKSKGRYWTAFTFLCVTAAWLTINVVWWTRTRQTGDLAIPAVLLALGVYLFLRESRRNDKK